jgi:hypothetical protein
VRADARASPPATSYHSLLDHPLPVLGVPALSHGVLVLLRLVTILAICLCLYRVRRSRVLRSGFRLGDYDAISETRIRNERCKTTVLIGTTSTFDAGGELDGQLLRTLARRVLGNMIQ